jgi:DNA-binding Xre family transcriptional regulator
MTKKAANRHRGSGLDDLLRSEGVFERFQVAAIKETIAFQIANEMKRNKLTKTQMAERMKTSRAQLNRLLDPKDGNVTLETLQRAAEILGREVRVDLV